MKNKPASKSASESYEPFKCVFPSLFFGAWSTDRIMKVVLLKGGYETDW